MFNYSLDFRKAYPRSGGWCAKAFGWDKRCHGIRLVDTHTSSLGPSPAELDSTPCAKSKTDSPFAKQLWKTYIAQRRTAVLDANKIRKGDGIWVLDYLAVDTGHQRNGVDERLVRWSWIRPHADGTWAIVEATPAIRPGYKTNGFQAFIYTIRFEAQEQCKGRRLPELAFVRRDCK